MVVLRGPYYTYQNPFGLSEMLSLLWQDCSQIEAILFVFNLENIIQVVLTLTANSEILMTGRLDLDLTEVSIGLALTHLLCSIFSYAVGELAINE